MGVSAIIPAIGTGLQVGQAVNSGIKGQRAGQQASAQMQQTNQLYNNMINQGMGFANQLGNVGAGFANPQVDLSGFLSGGNGGTPGVMSPGEFAPDPRQPSASGKGAASGGGGTELSRSVGDSTNPEMRLTAQGTGGALANFANDRRQSTASGKGSATGGQSQQGTLAQGILDNTIAGGSQINQNFLAGADALNNRGLQNQAASLLQTGGFGGLMGDINQAGGLQQFNPGDVFQGGIVQPSDITGQLSNVYTPGQFTPNQFAFNPVSQTANAAVQNAIDSGNRARATALEQAAIGFNQTGDAVDAALASRGLSGNSGVGAAALAQYGGQVGQQLTNLNRDIANQTQAAALQGAQFDIGNVMQLAGLGSQYNLGINQLTGNLGLGRDELIANQLGQRNALTGQIGLAGDQLLAGQTQAQNALIANQLMQNTALGAQFGMNQNSLLAGLAQAGQANDLGRSSQLAGLQGMQDATALTQTDLRNRAVTQPLGMLQSVYQSNYLAPQMQVLGLQSGLANSMLGQGTAGLNSNLAAMAQAAQTAGSGKGAASGGAIGQNQGKGTGKGAGTGTSPGPMPGFGVSF